MPWSQNVTVVLRAGNTIINPAGMFSYEPSPGAGNLVSSAGAVSAGTDQYGNAYLDGQVTYSSNAGLFWSALQNNGGELTWYEAASEAGPWTSEAGIGFSFNNITGGGLIFNTPAGISGSITLPIAAPSITSLPSDSNSGSTWVSGERAFMNSNWVNNINSNDSNIVTQLVLAGVF